MAEPSSSDVAQAHGAPGTIVTLGGGGFSMSDDGSSLIDDLLLELTGAHDPRVVFVPTASGDDAGYIERFENAFRGRARTDILTLFGRDPWGYRPAAEVLADADLVYVGGGSTFNLLALWRAHGLDQAILDAAGSGTVLAGISAGMNCWFEACSTDSFGPDAPLSDGLGVVPGAACPHYRGEPQRRPALHRWIVDGKIGPTWAADDHAAMIWRDGVLDRVVAERAGATAFRVAANGHGGITESALETSTLH